jgi:hypothetical protein
MLSPFRFKGVYHGLLSICGQKQQLFIWGGISPTRGGDITDQGGGDITDQGGGDITDQNKKIST